MLVQDPLPSIYDYQSPRRYLLDILVSRQRKDPSFSVRKWAKEMGLTSNAHLVMLLQGKRSIRLQHAGFLAKGLAHSSQEQLYFQALIQFENAPTPEEKQLCSVWLSDLHPGRKVRIREVEEHQILANWTHSALLTLAELDCFDGTPQSAYLLLKKRVSVAEISSCLERLLDLGFLERTSSGRVRPMQSGTSSKDDVPNSAVRRHLAQTLLLAGKALEEDAVEEREFRATSFVVRRDKIELAKKLIRNFQSKLIKALGPDENGTQNCEAYQLNIQFFQLTEVPGAKLQRTKALTLDSTKLKMKEGKKNGIKK